MKTLFRLFFLVLIVVGCQEQSKTSNTFQPDVSVQKIQLKNAANVKKTFGDDVTKNLLGFTMPQVSILSSNQRERFTMVYNPKNDSLQFSKFQVKINPTLDEVTPISPFPKFKTESGIQLGITMEELEKIKGQPDEKINDMVIKWIYTVDQSKLPSFLNYFNEEQYSATYVFLDNRLIEFSFGFEK